MGTHRMLLSALVTLIFLISLAAFGASSPQVRIDTGRSVWVVSGDYKRAAEIFHRLGATPWAIRADGELRATGITVSKADSGLALLTPQQRQIALLAAAGHTNKEIAARLFLSPRTVSTHLYQVFPKLGFTPQNRYTLPARPTRPRGRARRRARSW